MSERKKKGTANTRDKEFGLRIRYWRNMRGMSQEALGDAMGVTFQQVQKYERGTNRVAAGRIEALAEVLCVKITDLFELGDEKLTKLPKNDLEMLGKLAMLSKGQRKAVDYIINEFVG